jgi:hypothetical protein
MEGSSHGQPLRGGTATWGFGEGLTPVRMNPACYEMLHRNADLDGFIWLRLGPLAGCCEYSNELSGSIKGGKFLD